MNLEVESLAQTEITEHWIGGPLTEFLRLATLIERSARDNVVGKRIALRSSLSPMSPYEPFLDVRNDAFDPFTCPELNFGEEGCPLAMWEEPFFQTKWIWPVLAKVLPNQ